MERRRSRVSAAIMTLVVMPWVLAAPRVWAASLDEVYANRVAMSALNERCHLFEPSLASALAMSRDQARNAALRAGTSSAQLLTVARTAVSVVSQKACNAASVRQDALHLKSAFAAYRHVLRSRFPGRYASWSADRTVLETRNPTGLWALWATPAAADAARGRLGILAYESKTLLFSSWHGGQLPSQARLLLRDPNLAANPYLAGGLTPAPRSAVKVFYGANRFTAPEGGIGFGFSAEARAALAALDPREAAVIEFVFPTRDGDKTERLIYEVGDFAPADGFLGLGD